MSDSFNPEEMYNDDYGRSWVFPTKLVIVLCFFIFLVRMLLKNRKGSKQQTLQERLWRKFAFSHNELFDTMNQEEKELLKHTYLNTIQNAKSVLMKEYDGKKISLKKVSFALENNQINMIPNLSKMMD